MPPGIRTESFESLCSSRADEMGQWVSSIQEEFFRLRTINEERCLRCPTCRTLENSVSACDR